jgi:hypothetical protein
MFPELRHNTREIGSKLPNHVLYLYYYIYYIFLPVVLIRGEENGGKLRNLMYSKIKIYVASTPVPEEIYSKLH